MKIVLAKKKVVIQIKQKLRIKNKK